MHVFKRFILLLCVLLSGNALDQRYLWLGGSSSGNTRVKDISLPTGFQRDAYRSGSFQYWIQNLPLKQSDHLVTTYSGQARRGQSRHYRIVDIDIGDSDLQQCADTVMRLYAEYLFSIEAYDRIKFRFTSGDLIPFSRWMRGDRPVVQQNRVQWKQSGDPDRSYRALREYLKVIFMYAGSLSLSREMRKVNKEDIQAGDVFIHGGTPGHAVIVVDVARNSTGEIYFLVAQSDTPAQDVHILHNKQDPTISPWFAIYGGARLQIPRYTFRWSELRRFQ